MRVVAGKVRGLKLFGPPKTVNTRPLTDIAKEALFNIIADKVVCSKFLDLFAGTGAVGIEALSRGSKEATFVELEDAVIETIRKNLTKTRLIEYSKIIHQDVFEFLKEEHESYDIIFFGPPQFKGLWVQSLQVLDKNIECLAIEGIVILQCDPSEYYTIKLNNLHLVDQRCYGGVLLSFLRRV